MKKTFIRMLLVMAISWGTVWGNTANAQFTDLKTAPGAGGAKGGYWIWFYHWGLYFF